MAKDFDYESLIYGMLKLDVEKVLSSYSPGMSADYMRDWDEGEQNGKVGVKVKILKIIPIAWDWLLAETEDNPSEIKVAEMKSRNKAIKDFLEPRLSIDYGSEEVEDYLCEVVKFLSYTKEGEQPTFNIDDELFVNAYYMFDVKACKRLLEMGANPNVLPNDESEKECWCETTYDTIETRAGFGFIDMRKFVFDEPYLFWWTRSLDHVLFELLFAACSERLWCMFPAPPEYE